MIRFFNRARTDRGFALISALSLAILYFMLMGLMLVDSSRELAEARRFRSRVVASVVAENAAELAAVNLVSRMPRKITEEDDQGTMVAQFAPGGGGATFEITATGETSGVERQKATVLVEGVFSPPESNTIRINFTRHAQ